MDPLTKGKRKKVAMEEPHLEGEYSKKLAIVKDLFYGAKTIDLETICSDLGELIPPPIFIPNFMNDNKKSSTVTNNAESRRKRTRFVPSMDTIESDEEDEEFVTLCTTGPDQQQQQVTLITQIHLIHQEIEGTLKKQNKRFKRTEEAQIQMSRELLLAREAEISLLKRETVRLQKENDSLKEELENLKSIIRSTIIDGVQASVPVLSIMGNPARIPYPSIRDFNYSQRVTRGKIVANHITQRRAVKTLMGSNESNNNNRR